MCETTLVGHDVITATHVGLRDYKNSTDIRASCPESNETGWIFGIKLNCFLWRQCITFVFSSCNAIIIHHSNIPGQQLHCFSGATAGNTVILTQ